MDYLKKNKNNKLSRTSDPGSLVAVTVAKGASALPG